MKCIECSNPTEENTTLPKDHSLCDECFFNQAIEGADFYRHSDGSITFPE